MFTGIVESLGTIVGIESRHDGIALCVDFNTLNLDGMVVGDSIAVNGACLTVIKISENLGYFDVSPETLSKCLIDQWQIGNRVNLERALTLAKPLGGHLVSGHVDGVGVLLDRADGQNSSQMRFSVKRAIGRYIAIKGSVTVDGVSLTSNNVHDEGEQTLFELTLVPHTLAVTTLGFLGTKDRVHIEIDLIARYLERMSQSDRHANV